MLELALRLAFSLAVVVGLLLLLARFGAKRFKGASGALVRVVHRQPLSRTSAVAVVTVGSRVLVLGTTEHQVSVLAELDPEELVDEELVEAALTPAEPTADPSPSQPPPARPRRPRVRTTPASDSGVLAGSVFSASTWKQAMAAVSTKATPDEPLAEPVAQPVAEPVAEPVAQPVLVASTTAEKPEAAATPTKAATPKKTTAPKKATTPRSTTAGTGTAKRATSPKTTPKTTARKTTPRKTTAPAPAATDETTKKAS